MKDYSQDRYAGLAVTAFGNDGLSNVEQQLTLFDNLKHAIPGIRDGAAFLAFLPHMMVVVKGAAGRRQARNGDASETSAPGVLTHPNTAIASTPDGDPPHTMAICSSEERGVMRSHVTDTSSRRFGLSFQVARVWPSLTADFVKSSHNEPR
jgi:hypothetical protein